METTLFYSLISGVTAHYFLFIRSESLGPAHTQWEEIAQGHEDQEARVTEGHLRNCLPICTPIQHYCSAIKRNRLQGYATNG